MGCVSSANADDPSGKSSSCSAKGPKEPRHMTVNAFVAGAKEGTERTEELTAYARYLGIDPKIDSDLLWIAKEALAAPMPVHWSEHFHEKQGERLVFYYNSVANTSSWIHPLEKIHRDTYKQIVDFRSCMSVAEQSLALRDLQSQYDAARSKAESEALTWSKHTSQDGCTFFRNNVKDLSVWEDPRLAVTHELHLRERSLSMMKMHHGIAGSSAGSKSAIQQTLPFGQAPRSPSGQALPAASSSSPKRMPERLQTVEAIPSSGKLWQCLSQMLHVSDPGSLGRGRDVKEEDAAYNSLVPVKGWRIRHCAHWNIYEATRSLVATDMARAQETEEVEPVTTKLDGIGRWLGGAGECNEKILIHGTRPQNLLAIIRNGLSERVSNGMFGCGIYLAEDPSKMDQYCTSECQGPELEELYRELYPGGDEPAGRIFYCLVCRVLLGIPVYTRDGRVSTARGPLYRSSSKRELASLPKSPAISYHSLIAEAGAAEDGHIIQRHREYVVFDSKRVLEQYIIAYRREMRDTAPSAAPVLPSESEAGQVQLQLEDDADSAYQDDLLPRLPAALRERLQQLSELRGEGLLSEESYREKRRLLADRAGIDVSTFFLDDYVDL